MKKRLIHKFFEKSVATIIAIGLILVGVWFLETDVNVVSAAEVATLKEDGYYVQKFSASEFQGYRAADGNHTYPKLSGEPDWLFAGWFRDEACTTSVGKVTTVSTDVYAKFVDADLSYIKCQVTPDTDVTSETTNMRVISALDSNRYSGAGFYVTYKGNTQTCSVSTLYSRLSATDDGMACGYSPIAFNENGKYFSAIRLKNIGNTNFDEPFYIQSYWKTLDGTIVSGMSRYVRVEDSYNQIVNVPVRVYSDAKVTEGSVTVTYAADQFSLYKTEEYTTGYDVSEETVFSDVEVTDNNGTVTIKGSATEAVSAEGLFVNLRLQLKAGAGLESNTEFEVTGESFKNGNTDVTLDVSDVVFKNYPLAYGGTPDKSWYDEFCDEDEETYIISSAADLYGLAEIVNGSTGDYASEQFVNDKVILGADIIINEGTSSLDGWTPKAGTESHKWTSIGYNKDYAFAGSFDGQGHTISGIYLDDDRTDDINSGLFGMTTQTSVIKNFRLTNSYFKRTDDNAHMGSVIGLMSGGTLNSVYSDAVVISNGIQFGGLVGRAEYVPNSEMTTELDKNVYINNCWFDGKVLATGTSSFDIGGIVGIALHGNKGTLKRQSTLEGEIHITNCLNSGEITNEGTIGASDDKNAQFVGGIIGRDNWCKLTINIDNCLNSGRITVPNENQKAVGSIIGAAQRSGCVANITNTCATNESFTNSAGTAVAVGTDNTSGTVNGTPKLWPEGDLTGYWGYANQYSEKVSGRAALDIYTRTNQTGTFVIKGNSTPELKIFSEDWLDFGWYYDNKSSHEFTIHTAEEMYALPLVCDRDQFGGDTILLGADIRLNEGSANDWAEGKVSNLRNWTPIGTNDKKFSGTFNGQGHTISGLYFVNESTTESYSGLFGVTEITSVVQNFRLTNSYLKREAFTASAYSTYGNNWAWLGSVIGFMRGGVLDSVYSDAIVTSNGTQFGGLVGVAQYDNLGSHAENMNVHINNCWFDGEVLATENGCDMGGIVGVAQQYSASSSTAGEVNITNCLNSGKLSCEGTSGTKDDQVQFIGGIIGRDAYRRITINISNCLNTGEITVPEANQKAVGSIIGAALRSGCVANITNTCATKESFTNSAGTAVAVGTDKTSGTVNGTPKLWSEGDLTGYWGYANQYSEKVSGRAALDIYTRTNQTGTFVIKGNSTPELKIFSEDWLDFGWYYDNKSSHEFTIHTAEEMYTLPLVCSARDDFANDTVRLGADIILNEGSAKDWASGAAPVPAKSWTPIGSWSKAFAGTFDGGNHSIKGLYLNATTDKCGLFASASQTATICNLKLENSFFETSRTDYVDMGSIVGMGEGTMTNVYSDAIIHSSASQVGGLVGRVQRPNSFEAVMTMTSCWFDGQIVADITENVDDNKPDIGGLVGVFWSGSLTMDTCLYTGSIDVDYVNISLEQLGKAVGVGGFCGYGRNYPIVVKNSLSAGTIDVEWKNCPELSYTDEKHPMGLTEVASVVGGTASTDIRTAGAVVAVTDITKRVEYDNKVVKTTTAVDNNSVTNFVVETSYTEDDLYGIGGYMLTDLPFTRAEGDTITPIWAAREGQVPAPASLVTDAMDLTEYVDTSWYSVEDSETEYTLSTKEELYGLSKLSRSNTFAGETIYLDPAGDSDAITFASTDTWYPIGIEADGKRFAGTFDGQEYTISGIHSELSAKNLGFFAATEVGSTVKNLRLKNSYFKQEGSGYVGSIISECRGNVSNVYSDATVCSEVEQVGGIVGRANGYDYIAKRRTAQTIDDCWFAGTIDLNQSGHRGGGIIGCLIQGEWTLTNCLFTGSIDCEYTGTSYAYLGGMVSEVQAPESVKDSAGTIVTTGDSKLTLNSCVSAGAITTKPEIADKGAGAFVGRMQAKVLMDETNTTLIELLQTQLVMNDVFATRETSSKDVGNWSSASYKVSDEVTYTAQVSLSGEVVWTHNADRLIGYCKEDTIPGVYEGANLDFTTPKWIMRDKDTPVPATFDDLVTKVDTSTLDAAIGLDTWDASLADAIHYGVGEYVLRFGSKSNNSVETYKSYVEQLAKSEAEGGLGFTEYANTTSGTEGSKVYSGIYTKADGDWVLNVVCSENSGITTITINTGIQGTLSPNLVEANVVQTTGDREDISITMLQLTGTYQDNTSLGIKSYYYGSSFVIQLPKKGHFIVNDGGNVGDYEGLIAYLKKQAGTEVSEDGTVTNPVYIDAWTVSHQDTDHFSAVEGFVSNPDDIKSVFVEAFYINEPNNRALYYVHKDSNGTYTRLEGALEAQYRGVRMLKTSQGKATPVYWYQTGQRYYFDGVTMDVIQSQEQIPVGSYAKRSAASDEGTDFNTASTVLLFTTDNNKKILIGGDANYVNMDCIMDMYGTDTEGYTKSALLQDINVFAAWHHGKNTSYNINNSFNQDFGMNKNKFTDYLTTRKDFDVVLYPCSIIYGDDADMSSQDETGAYPHAGEANEYLNSKTTEFYHYGNGNVTISF